MEREGRENSQVPGGVADGYEEDRARPHVDPTPEETADGRGQDEHEIAGRRMDEGVERRGGEKARPSAETPLPAALEPGPPKQFLAGADEKRQQQDDPSGRDAGFKPIDTADIAGGKWEERVGGLVTGEEYSVEDGGRN